MTEIKEAIKKKVKAVNKKKPVNVVAGRAYVTATFNNTLITFTDSVGNALASGSSGMSGFKGSRKSTPFAATTAMESVARKMWDQGMKEVEVYIKGPGVGRDAALRVLKTVGFIIKQIADVTPIPHNGPRAKKKRRV